MNQTKALARALFFGASTLALYACVRGEEPTNVSRHDGPSDASADVHSAVHLHRVDAQDFRAADLFGHAQRERGFT